MSGVACRSLTPDTLRCDLCHRERPSSKIGAFNTDRSGEFKRGEGSVVEMVLFCIDSHRCRNDAQTFRHLAPPATEAP